MEFDKMNANNANDAKSETDTNSESEINDTNDTNDTTVNSFEDFLKNIATPNSNNNENNLHKVVFDFIEQLESTFPEFENNYLKIKQMDEDKIRQHCLSVLPERFFDILYQNEDIFKKENEINTMFLPELDFKLIWNLDDLSENNKNSIWKYLQLIMFSIVGNIDNSNVFGDTAKIFEAISEGDLQSKLKETMDKLQNIFNFTKTTDDDDDEDIENDNTSGNSFRNNFNLPNPEDLQEHISQIMDGKIGQLATEIAEEASKEFDVSGNSQNIQDLMNDMLKNPQRIMELVKKVGGKLNDKIQSGEIKESELLSEASDILSKMKNMPGMGDISKMFGKMGMPMPNMGGKGSKVNVAAMQNKVKENLKKAQTKERIQKKIQQKQMEKIAEEAMKKAREDILNQMKAEENMNILLEKLEKEEKEDSKQSSSSKTINKKNVKKKKKGKK